MQRNKNNNAIFGEALRRLRKAAGKSQEALAWEAGLDRTYISLLELDARSPTLATMLALCRGLQISFMDMAVEIDRLLDV